MLSRSAYFQKLLRRQQSQFLDNMTGWTDTGQTDTGIPDDRDSLIARIEALELKLQEVQNANN